MGDHLPDFIALSFDERRGGPPRASLSDEAADETVEDQTDIAGAEEMKEQAVPTLEAKAEAEAPKPKRRRRKKADMVDDSGENATVTEVAAETEA